MSICTISDLHIKTPNDQGHELLRKFLSHPQVRSAKHIALLGDIFDVWVGDVAHKYSEFQDVFESLAELSAEGKIIYYFEGNHDLHLRNLEVKVPGLQYVRDFVVVQAGASEVMLSHGDWFDVEDRFYYHYRRVIASPVLAKFLFATIGEKTVNHLGVKASMRSRSRNNKRYSDEVNEIVKQKFRSLAQATSKQYGIKTIVWGHSHTKDLWQMPELTYVNNGYAPVEKVFNYIARNGQVAQIPL